MSVCELEVDAVAADVLNRLEIESKGVCVCVCMSMRVSLPTPGNNICDDIHY